MTEQHIAVCEALDWRVHDDPEEDYVELEKYSPAGEDFIFGVQKGNFVKNVREYADGFDVDEHVELWIEGRGKNGVPDRKSTRLNSSHPNPSRMPSSA